MTTYPDICGWIERAGSDLTPGMLLRFMRQARELTVEAVATCAGVSAVVLGEVEQGLRSAPSPAWGGAVADAVMALRGGETR